MSRLIQRLTTLASRLFSPGLRASVTSTRNGDFQSMPRFFPLSFSSAITATLPRSRYHRRWAARGLGGTWILQAYIAVPEKYLTPASGWSLQEISFSNITCEGAPAFVGNFTVHGPVIFNASGSAATSNWKPFCAIARASLGKSAKAVLADRAKTTRIDPMVTP